MTRLDLEVFLQTRGGAWVGDSQQPSVVLFIRRLLFRRTSWREDSGTSAGMIHSKRRNEVTIEKLSSEKKRVGHVHLINLRYAHAQEQDNSCHLGPQTYGALNEQKRYCKFRGRLRLQIGKLAGIVHCAGSKKRRILQGKHSCLLQSKVMSVLYARLRT